VNAGIRSKLSTLPHDPGVYFMKGHRGQVLYVGKAKNLKARVSSYFTNSKEHSAKTRSLVREICDFDIMLVKTEVDALLLERTLIKNIPISGLISRVTGRDLRLYESAPMTAPSISARSARRAA
jgi:excinuclease UvrABC nuclease subunit